MNLPAIKAIAEARLSQKSSHAFKERGNKYYHGLRVAALALRLREIVLPGDTSRDQILTAAAYFHDIANGAEKHEEAGAEMTREILTDYCKAEELDEICFIISAHDKRNGEVLNLNVYAKLHQDADLLDHYGTFDVWSTFLWAVGHNRTIEKTREYLLNEHPDEHDKYRRELNFAVSLRIFDEKVKFMQNFTERFDVECSGGIWDERRILEELEREGLTRNEQI